MRVLVLNGPRQAGKTTLLRQLIAVRGGELRNLDDEVLRLAALDDPAQFVASDVRPLCIDEVQRAGDPLIRAVKAVVDADDARGQFVLAGSTRFLAEPTLGESLAGRAGVLEVLPFSQGELTGAGGNFLDDVSDGGVARLRRRAAFEFARSDYVAMMVRGGFPEPSQMTARLRGAWFANYLQAVAERDIREMARINQPSAAGRCCAGWLR